MSAGEVKAGGAYYEIGMRDNTRSDLAAAEKNLNSFADRLDKRAKSLTIIGAATTGLGLGLLAPLKGASEEAGNFEETLNRFKATFGELSDETQSFAANFGAAANRFEGDVLNALSGFQGFLVGANFDPAQATELSKAVTQLTEDFGSFNNINSDLSRIKVLGALAGETEGVKEFGVNVRTSAVDQEFLRLGMSVTNKTATEQQKILARLSILYQSLDRQGAIGDAIRTADSFVNTQRGVEAAFKEVRVAIGGAINPLRADWNAELVRGARVARDFIKDNEGLVRTYAKVGTAVALAGGVITAVGVAGIVAATGLDLMTSSAENVTEPLAKAAATGQAVGVETAKGAATGTSFLGRMGAVGVGALGGILTLSSQAAIAFGNVVKGVSLVVGALGVLPALAIAAAGGLLLIKAGSNFEGFKNQVKELTVTFILLSKVVAGIGVGIVKLDEALGLDAARTKANQLFNTLLRFITSFGTTDLFNDPKKVLLEATDGLLDDVRGDLVTLLRFTASGGDQRSPTRQLMKRLADKLEANEKKGDNAETREEKNDDIIKETKDGISKTVSDLKEQVKDLKLDEQFDVIMDELTGIIPTIKTKDGKDSEEVAKIKAEAEKLVKDAKKGVAGFDPAESAKEIEKRIDFMFDTISKKVAAVSDVDAEGFIKDTFQKDLEKKLKGLDGGIAKAGKSLGSSANTGSFSARSLLSGAQSRQEKALDTIAKQAVKQTDKLDGLKNAVDQGFRNLNKVVYA